MTTTDAPPPTPPLILFPGPSSFQPHSSPPPPPTPPQQQQPPPPTPPVTVTPFSLRNRPPLRITTEFDSDSSEFFHKVSSTVFSGLAKLKLSFRNSTRGEAGDPQVSIVTKNFSVDYDVSDRNALFKGVVPVGPNLKISAVHDLKAQQGEATLIANLSDPGYQIKLSSVVPSIGLPKATFKFPCGEVSVEEREDEEVKRILSVDGIVKGSILNGLCTAVYKDENLNLRYSYKDDELSFIPSISLPSNAVSFAFKRRFSPADKLSYWYNCDTNYWSTVYKHTVGKDYKLKAGYDSEIRMGWASLWVGDEAGKAKTSPMKMKVQFMLQVPQDDIKSSIVMFRVKKRWDI